MKQISYLLIISTVLLACNRQEAGSDAYGNFEAIEIMVSAETSGRILELTAQEGDKLKAGEVMARVDTTQLYLKKLQLESGFISLSSRIGTLKAQIKANEVQLENLKREEKRVANLAEGGAATSKQQDDIQGQVAHMKAQIQAQESQEATIYAERKTLELQIQQMEDQLARCLITSPVDGVILTKYKEKDEIVAAGQSLLKMANMDELILRAYISGDQLAEVKTGDQLKIKYDKGGSLAECSGTLSWVSSSAEFTPKIIQTRDERVNLVYAIKVRVANDGSLKIGMPGEVIF